MPKATVTVRELKNKDTGIDLSVTSYREIPGLMRSTFEYQIVVVSSLSCFKLPSHKESDVVQFTLFKKFPEFEDLRGKLNEAFSGTALPPLVKKSLIVNEAVVKERRNNLDAFVRFLAATPRVVTCSHVLTFLGVEAQKARRFASGETEGSAQVEDGRQEEKDGEGRQDGMASSSLFGGDDEEEEEEEVGGEFLSEATSGRRSAPQDDDFFSTSDTHGSASRDARLFESQDLKRELTEEDEKEFAFIPDAIIHKRQVAPAAMEDSESDLFQVDEDIDLDKLLTLETSSKQAEEAASRPHPPPQPTPPSKPQPAARPSPPPPAARPSPPAARPSPPARPKPAPKPAISSPKPAISSPKPSIIPAKPAVPERGPNASASASASKPEVPERPKPAPRKLKPGAAAGGRKGEGEGGGKGKGKEELSSDDIMQYIAAANVDEQEVDLDLFS